MNSIHSGIKVDTAELRKPSLTSEDLETITLLHDSHKAAYPHQGKPFCEMAIGLRTKYQHNTEFLDDECHGQENCRIVIWHSNCKQSLSAVINSVIRLDQ